MELYWQDESLKTKVHLKKNQLLKYLNNGSTHAFTTFKSIHECVLQRLTKLTSVTPKNKGQQLNELYPNQVKAL